MKDFVTNALDLQTAKDTGVDILYKMESKPLVFGLRYEVLEYDKAGDGYISGSPVGVQTKFDGSRVDVLFGTVSTIQTKLTSESLATIRSSRISNTLWIRSRQVLRRHISSMLGSRSSSIP